MSDTGTVAPAPLVPDEILVDVPVGGRVLIVSDLQLERDPTPSSTSASVELALTVASWTGPGTIIFNGDLFELLGATVYDPKQALISHARLTQAVKSFRQGEARRVVVLPGSTDARLAWDDKLCALIQEQLGAEVALAAVLTISTGCGPRTVRVEPGHRFDARHAFADPRNPVDTPLGYHIVREVLPALGQARTTWLAGVDRLRDRVDFPRFVASRLAYRRLVRYTPWILLPFALALALKVPLIGAFVRRPSHFNAWPRRLVEVGVTTALDLLLVIAGVYLLTRRAWAAMSGVALGERGLAQNDRARDDARALVTAGYAGLVTAHTHRPELTHLGRGFYANCGCATEVLDERDARFGLPPVFLSHRELSWVELEAGADLHVRLLRAGLDLPGGSMVERLVARRGSENDSRPVVVATFPQGESWPAVTDPGPWLRRVRRRAAGAIAIAGLFDLASALSPPVRERLHAIDRVVPLAVPQTATALVAFAGFGLLLLARGVRRGQRQAWNIALALLLGSSLLHLLKGIDFEEAVAALVVSAYLFTRRAAFRAAVDRPSVRRSFTMLVTGLVGAIALATAVVEFFHGAGRPRPPLPRALAAVAERIVGITTIHVFDRTDDFLTPALVAVGVGLALACGWLAFRPVVARRHPATGDAGMDKAREIVARHGHGTLDYFALRSDKHFFFAGDSLVAYAVYSGVCLVSPDPIGPAAERDIIWDEFRRFADERGWAVAVMGAGEDWLPVYREAGMHDLYVGDEAVVDLGRFNLEGGRNKGLRQAVNRIAKYGYTVSFHDPAALDPDLRQRLTDVMTKSRKGDVERGFSMTLSRIFDPEDKGLLLTVVHGPDGGPVAFCQFVPSPGINGYSLDLMRRDPGEHPNGLTDFAVVETIRHIREQGRRGLSLNFATMRAVLAGEAGDNLAQRVEGWLLRRMSGSMQIESLWKFNAKFDPDWQPRYAVYDSPENLLPAAMAVARAESFWELPLIGRFLVPNATPIEPPATNGDRESSTANHT